MKKLNRIFAITGIVLVSTAFTIIGPQEYDDGYKDGFCEAYRDCKGGAYAKCVYPSYINNEPYINGFTGYKDGWKAGFKHGQKEWCR